MFLEHIIYTKKSNQVSDYISTYRERLNQTSIIALNDDTRIIQYNIFKEINKESY